MILALDVGNTNIKIALALYNEIVMSWRISAKQSRTADEFGIELSNLLSSKNYSITDIDGVIISSVVPTLNYTLVHAITYYIGVKPIIVSHELNTGISIKYNPPSSLGADRIANAVGAYYTYCSESATPCIIIDFGTATTFGVINKNAEFIGGCIAPGIKTSLEALSTKAAKLPLVELVRPTSAIANDTIKNLQSGVIIGFKGLVKEIIGEFKKELQSTDIKVIATGGLTQLIDDESFIDILDRSLTLKGLIKLYELNK